MNYHKLYRRPRGMYFSANDRGEMVGARSLPLLLVVRHALRSCDVRCQLC